MMKNLILTLIVFLSLGKAKADYFQADLKSTNVDPSMGVHLIIAGKGMEVGDQWLTAAHTQAMIFNDKAKHGPIRLISAIDDKSTFATKLARWGYENVQVFNQTMNDARVVKLISLNSKISSLDFIGHNGVFLGFALEDYSNRFYKTSVDLLKATRGNFTADSYIRIMGCNTGWILAPYFAEAMSVPVSGTFTFADIQDLFTDNIWYYNDEGRHPEKVKVITQNLVSFSKPENCLYAGGCKRLKPVTISYAGKHGSYSGTVPFPKYFCGSLSINDCARRAALSVTTQVSTVGIKNKPTALEYQKVVSDLLCSSWQDLSKRAQCQKSVTDHLSGIKSVSPAFTTITDPLLVCNFKTCESKVSTIDGKTVMQGVFNKVSTTFYDELNFYKLGFSLL